MKNPNEKAPFMSRIQAGISYEKFIIMSLEMSPKFFIVTY